MKIKCHQFLHGHSTQDGYAAKIVESRNEAKASASKSFLYPFLDQRRDISDKNTYVLEIEPMDDRFDNTAAICSQWKTEGTRSQYTHWLIPVDGKTESTMLLLKHDSFMSGNEASEVYEKNKVLTYREVEVPDVPQCPEWQMTEQQQKTLGQFLALYWLSLTQSQPSKGTIGNRIPLIIRDSTTNELLTNERAAEFFNREIVSRLPFEARGMISAVFGIKWNEQSSFKKAVCVVLSSETGAPTDKKIDLLKCTHDLLSKYPHDDREAMNSLGQCLMQGETAYPEWYIKLRSLKNGIPKSVAPYVMILSIYLDQSNANVSFMEQCYTGLFTHTLNGGAEEEDIHRVLAPLAERISRMWLEQAKPSIDFYNTKKNWLTNVAKMPEKQVSELLEPLAEKVLGEYKSNYKISTKEKIKNSIRLLESLKGSNSSNVKTGIEDFLAVNAEELIEMLASDENQNDSVEKLQLKTDSFERILSNWKKDKVTQNPSVVLANLTEVLKDYPAISIDVKDQVYSAINRLNVDYKVEELSQKEKHGEFPTLSDIKGLADLLNRIGNTNESEKTAAKTMQYIQNHYLTWIMEEPAIIREDKRFLDLAKQWINSNLIEETRDFDAEKMEILEKNLLRVMDEYHESSDSKNECLSVFRSIKGRAQIDEILNETVEDPKEIAIKIADLHHSIRSTDATILNGTELENRFTEVMQQYYLDWSRCEPPFASGFSSKYTDDWFLKVTAIWLESGIRQYSFVSESIIKLENSILSALKAYRLPDEQQKTLLNELRNLRGSAQFSEVVNNNEVDQTERAISIASIHDNLKVETCAIDQDLENEMKQELTASFLSWWKASKPFASNKQYRYSDDWFVGVATEWLTYHLEETSLTCSELEKLEKDLIAVLNSYKVSREAQQGLLLNLRKIWGREKIREVIEDADSDNIKKAMEIAGIHNRLRKIPGAIMDDDWLEQDLRRNMVDLFLDWSKATKPFPSGTELRYEDDWFVTVAKEWLSFNDNLQELSSDELEKISKDLVYVLGYYHMRGQTDEMLRPVYTQWCKIKLQELLEKEADTTVVLQIAGIHNRFRHIPGIIDQNDEDALEYALLQRFVIWGQCEKPFASSENLRYEDPWFESILNKWVDNWLESEPLSSDELLSLAKHVDDACRAYRIKDNGPIKTIRRKYARAYVDENTGTTQTDSIAKIAELLFKERAISEDDGMRDDLVDYLAENFEEWAKMSPSFSTGESANTVSISAQNELFLNILSKWQEKYLMDEADVNELNKIRDLIHHGFNTFKISSREFERKVARLDLVIKKGRFEDLRAHIPTPEETASVAGIRAWITDKSFSQGDADRILEDIDSFLLEHMNIWLSHDHPLFVEDYGYQQKFPIDLLNQWIENGIDLRSISIEEAKKSLRAIDVARKEYKSLTGADITADASEKLDTLDCQVFIDSLPLHDLSTDQVQMIAEKLILMEKESELRTNLLQKMVDNYLAWFKTNPPFSCGKCDLSKRDNLVIQVTDMWVAQDCPADELLSANMTEIIQSIQSINRYKNTVGADDLVSKLKLFSMRLKMQELRSKSIQEYSSDDIFTVLDIYIWAKDLPEQKKLWDDTRETLINAFAIWGKKCNFSLSADSNGKYGEVDFIDLLNGWLDKIPRYQSESLEEIKEVKNKLKSVATPLYSLTPEDSNDANWNMTRCQIEIMVNQLLQVSNPPIDIIDEGFEVFSLALDRLEKQDPSIMKLKRVLVAHYMRWIESVHKEVKPDALLIVTKDWLENEFGQYSFGSLAEYVTVKEALQKQLSNNLYRFEDYEMINVSLETRWLREAIRFYDLTPSPISTIASYGKSIPNTKSQLEQSDILLLDNFLLTHFIAWSKESYQSIIGQDLYVYPRFTDLMNEWFHSEAIKDISSEKLDRLDDILTKVLTDGYGYTQEDSRELMIPLAKRKRELIIEQARRSLDENSLVRIHNMYKETPEEVFTQTFDVFLSVAKRGEAKDQIAKFIEDQSVIWDQSTSNALHKGVVEFLNEMFNLFDAEDRPPELTETMAEILEKLNYDLSSFDGNLESWITIKNRIQDKRIKAHIKDASNFEDLPEQWEKNYSKEYGLSWQQVLQRPVFKKELTQRLQQEWDVYESEKHSEFISNLFDFAISANDQEYKKILLEAVSRFVVTNFDALFSSPENQRRIHEIITTIQKNGIDIGNVTLSEAYKEGVNYQKYEALNGAWNKKDAVDLLRNKPDALSNPSLQLSQPNLNNKSTEDTILLLLIYYKLSQSGLSYWNECLNDLNIDLQTLNNKDLKEISMSNFVEVTFDCYSALTSNGILWAVDDLKEFIKQSAPSFWKAIHPFMLFGLANTWKKIGGDKLPENEKVKAYKDWLLKGR